MDRRLEEEACSNSLNNRRLSRRNFEIGDCARPPPPPPPQPQPPPPPTTHRRETIVPTTRVFSRNGRLLRHIGTQRSLRESPPSVRVRDRTRRREGGRKGEGEKGRGERERKRRRREGGGKRRQFPVSLNKRVHSDASPSARLCMRVCACMRMLDSVQPFGNPDFPIISHLP